MLSFEQLFSRKLPHFFNNQFGVFIPDVELLKQLFPLQ